MTKRLSNLASAVAGGLVLLSPALWWACDSGEPCETAGVSQACNCDDGRNGTQVCQDDLVWAECVCTSTPGGSTYRAVLVRDGWSGTCASSDQGADIDAVALYDNDGQILGYAETVYAAPGCSDLGHQDGSFAKGAPDGSKSSGYVSLGGGSLAVEFAGSPAIVAGYAVQVFEVDDNTCSGCEAEPYSVYLIQSASCAGSGSCNLDKSLGSATGTKELQVTLSGL